MFCSRPSCRAEIASFHCADSGTEAVIVAFRKHTLLPLDDGLYALQATIPRLTRSSLHRCLERHGISRLPKWKAVSPAGKSLNTTRSAISMSAWPKRELLRKSLYLFVVIDRTSKFTFAELVQRADMRAAAFLEALVAAVPYRIHAVLTDNGLQFADVPRNRKGPTARWRGILRQGLSALWHRTSLDQTQSPLDQRTGRTHESNHQRSHCPALPLHSHNQLQHTSPDFLAAYNFAKLLKTLGSLTSEPTHIRVPSNLRRQGDSMGF